MPLRFGSPHTRRPHLGLGPLAPLVLHRTAVSADIHWTRRPETIALLARYRRWHITAPLW